MKQNILKLCLLAFLLSTAYSYGQIKTIDYTNRIVNGIAPTIYTKGYRGKIYIGQDKIKIVPKKGVTYDYNIIKSKEQITGNGKEGFTITSYLVESPTSVDPDLKIKVVLTEYNKPQINWNEG